MRFQGIRFVFHGVIVHLFAIGLFVLPAIDAYADEVVFTGAPKPPGKALTILLGEVISYKRTEIGNDDYRVECQIKIKGATDIKLIGTQTLIKGSYAFEGNPARDKMSPYSTGENVLLVTMSTDDPTVFRAVWFAIVPIGIACPAVVDNDHAQLIAEAFPDMLRLSEATAPDKIAIANDLLKSTNPYRWNLGAYQVAARKDGTLPELYDIYLKDRAPIECLAWVTQLSTTLFEDSDQFARHKWGTYVNKYFARQAELARQGGSRTEPDPDDVSPPNKAEK